MADDMLLGAAGQIADGADVDWALTSSTLSSVEDLEIAEELEVVARIARSHRELHDLLPVAPDTPPQLVPDRTRWGHLDLLNILGRGSYGTVYRAWDTRLERLVALKLFHGASDPSAVMREGRMLARVRNENVVTVYGADIIDGIAGIWMELVHGRTLDQIVRADGPMDARQAASIGADVARALAAVHNAGLLHCDIKAQNVVRENSGRVVLMDLGAGRPVPEAENDTYLSDVAGTPRYMAPELFQFAAKATRATDAYSFGVLLYYLASAKFPVDGRSMGELKQAHIDGRVRRLDQAKDGLPARYVALVTRTLDPNPAQRPSNATEIQGVLAELAAPAPAPSLLRSVGVLAAVATGVAVLIAIVSPAVTRSTPPAPAVRTIAVLPIKNLTGDPSKAYIADGLTEVLISNLARVPSLRVPSFAAVAPFRESLDSPDLAKRLGVQLLLAGSIAQANDQIRLTVHLSDSKGTAIWGDEITRDVEGVMGAQTDLSRRLAQQLALAPGVAPEWRSRSPRAEDAYLRGLALRVSSPGAQEDAARAFREAVELDPGFADAWAQLSLIEAAYGERRLGHDREQSRTLAKEMADRALQLDPGLPNGFAVLGTIQFYMDWDYTAAEQSLRRAVTLSPSSAFAGQRFSMLLSALKRFDEAIAVATQSQQLEPTVALRLTNLGTVYYYARRYDLAEREMRLALSVTPDFGVAHFGLGRIAAARGNTDVAIAEIKLALAQNRNSSWLVELARTYAQAGQPDNVQAVMQELTDRQRGGDTYSKDNLAYIAAAEGRFDEAFALLQSALDERNAAMLWIAVDPRVDPLRNDPRFSAVLQAMKLQP